MVCGQFGVSGLCDGYHNATKVTDNTKYDEMTSCAWVASGKQYKQYICQAIALLHFMVDYHTRYGQPTKHHHNSNATSIRQSSTPLLSSLDQPHPLYINPYTLAQLQNITTHPKASIPMLNSPVHSMTYTHQKISRP